MVEIVFHCAPRLKPAVAAFACGNPDVSPERSACAHFKRCPRWNWSGVGAGW